MIATMFHDPCCGPRRRRAAAAASLLVGLGFFAGCGSAATTSAPHVGTTPLAAPLDISSASATGTWAVVAMGYLGQPNNTFWEAFYRPTSDSAWSLRTPRGVADNGGLIAAVRGKHVTFGVRPSNDLRFSPLAISSDLGASYSPALLPDSLGDAPDALSTSATGRTAALTGNQILTSGPAMSGWQTLASAASLQASSAGQQCGVKRLTAVVVATTSVAIGADCARSGVAGVFTTSGSSFDAVGPTLSPGMAAPGATVDVARLVSYRDGLAALFETPTSAGATYQAAWRSTPSGPWTVGPTLRAGTLDSASVTSAGGFSIVTGRAPDPRAAAFIEPTSPSWVRLADPPARTATVCVATSRTDALVVNDSTFTDYRLSTGRWIAVQSIKVPVPIGSSS